MNTQTKALAPLVDVREAAQIAGIPSLRYRRVLLNAEGHPKPISNGRPLLFRRSEICAWLGVNQQTETA